MLKNALLAVAAVLITVLGIEYGYRYHLTQKFSHANYPFLIADAPFRVEDLRARTPDDGLYVKDTVLNYHSFDAGHNALYNSRIHFNADGYRSDHTYPRPGSDTYRIAVLGDSMTANFQSDRTWTDIAGEMLNADTELKARLGVPEFAVMNFGINGAGFETMAQVHWDHARKFEPQLTVVNFITPDLLRHQVHVEPVDDLGLAPREYRGLIDVSANGVPAKTAVFCDTPTIDFVRPDCRPSTLIFVDESHARDREAIAAIRLALSGKFLWSKLWQSTYPYAWSAALSRPFVLDDRSFMDIFTTSPAPRAQEPGEPQDPVSLSALAIRKLSANAPNLALFHTPLGGELRAGARRHGMVVGFSDQVGVPVCFMEDFLPNPDIEHVNSWFHPEPDGHFTNRGVAIYGEAVYRALRAILIEQHDRGATASDAVIEACRP